jgi:hypothetical protein
MTKARAPLTIDAALARIAGTIPGGWKRMGELCARIEHGELRSRSERTVRNWGDPDTSEQIPLDCAIVLDIEFQKAGGDGFPLFDTYQHLIDIAISEKLACNLELARRTRAAIREGGEAHDALVAAILPGATAAERAAAVKEVLEAIEELKGTLPHLTEGAGPDGVLREGTSPGGDKA